MSENQSYTIKVWRQDNTEASGKFVEYDVKEISPDASFLEMLDLLNNELALKGEEPIAFDYELREGIATSTNALKLMEIMGFSVIEEIGAG